MRHITRTRLAIAALSIALLLCVSCLERSEEITVAEDGTVTIVASFDGKATDFAPPVALPSEPEWEIDEHKTDTNEAGEATIKLKARKSIPYGEDLPYSYASGKQMWGDINLMFPTEIDITREGDRTIYEFERTYSARDYAFFNLSTSHYWDQELEDRVIENGIFEVSEQDRNDYLSQYCEAFSYFQWRFVDMILGELVGAEKLSPEKYEKIDTHVWNYLKDEITPARILGILGKNEDAIEQAHYELKTQVMEDVLQIIFSYEPFFEDIPKRLENLEYLENTDILEDTLSLAEAMQMIPAIVEQTLQELMPMDSLTFMMQYATMHGQLYKRYELTERIGGHSFTVTLHMPGTIIVSNGLRDPEEPSSVEWNFKGEDMRDRTITLRAISVVDE